MRLIMVAALALAGSARAAEIACVTGATGYLGQEVVFQLLEKGYEVRGTVRSPEGANAQRLVALARSRGLLSSLALVEADLLGGPEAFGPCVMNASVLFHTASPFVTTGVEDPMRELVDPAVRGTEAAVRAALDSGTVASVVVTSSIAATMGGFGDKAGGACFDEGDWNWSSEAKVHDNTMDAYRFSKLAAEKRFWELLAAHDASRGTVRGAAVLPAFIVGPPRTARADGESLKNMVAALSGAFPPRGDTPMVDVRDAAAAHVAAHETAGASGVAPPEAHRYLVSTPSAYRRDDLLRLVAAAFPDHRIAKPAAPPPSRADRAADRVVFCSKNLRKLEGVAIRPAAESLADMAEAMAAFGVADMVLKTGPLRRLRSFFRGPKRGDDF